ncbi:MAG: TonB-dependent receptor [Gallionella sp.]
MKSKKIFALSLLSLSVMQAVYAEETIAPVESPVSVSVPEQEVAPIATVEVVAVAKGSDATLSLGDVVVSASKIAQSTKEAPANVTVLNAKKLEVGNNFVLGDALTAKVPSLHLRGGAVDGGRAGATMQSSFRGQGLNRNLLLVDGQSMTDAYSGQMNWSAVSLNDVERIEVIPGVGSALYGSAALGGVISVVTKAPIKREFTIKATKGFSDGARKKLDVGYRDKFENGFGVVMNASQDERDGYAAEFVTLANPVGVPVAGAKVVTGLQPTTTTTGAPTNIIGDKGLNASRALNANLKLFYDVTTATKVYAGVAYTQDTNINTPYHVYLIDSATGKPLVLPSSNTLPTNLNINGKKSSLKESAFFGTNPGGRSALRTSAGIDTEIFDDYKLKVNIGKIDHGNWSTGAASTTTNTMTTGAGTLSDSPSTVLSGSTELSFGATANQFIVTGVAFEQDSLSQKKYTVSNWTDMNSKTAVKTSANGISTTTSLFLQDQIAATEVLTIYAGGRYDAWRSSGDSRDFVTPANNVSNPNRTASSFNPKLAGVYKLTEAVSLKGSLGTGFRAPNNYEMYANPTFSGAAAPNGKLILANPNLKPETAQAWDMGAEMDLSRGGAVKVSYYQTKMKDMIYQKVTAVTPYILPGTVSQVNFTGQQDNVASALIRGVELSGETPITHWLAVSASYTYTNAKITGDNGTNSGMVGKRVSNVPQNMASLGFDAKFGDFSIATSSRYTANTWGSADNLNTDVVKNVWTGYSDYWLSDMKVAYKIDKNFKATLAIGNVFDKKYFAYYAMPGRSATVDLSATF